VVISAALTMRARAALPAAPKRFSGSTVVLRMPSLLSQRRLSTPIRVAIVRDDGAAAYYDTPTTLDTIARRWRDLLTAAGADAEIVRPAQLRRSDAKVVVVPSSPCLTLDTREAIEMAGVRGQGLIVTGAVGTHDGGCRRIGYGLLIELTGASRAEPLRGRAMAYVTIPSRGPLSADIPPGARLNVSPAGQIALRAPGRDAFYSDYTLGAEPARREPFFDAAIVRSSYRGARVVYFGFELKDATADAWNQAVIRLLVRNVVAWTGDLAMASVESWPDGFAGAAIIAQDVEGGFENSAHALDSLRDAGIRSTYFVTSNIALRNRSLTRRLSNAGEIGTHSENHQLLGGVPFASQLARLQTTQRDLNGLLDMPVRGLRPPEEQFDEATMAAWLDAGGTYLLGANDSRCAAPELLAVQSRGKGDTLLLIPRVFSDDIAAAGAGWTRPPSVVRAKLHDGFVRARALGGLYVLSYHSHLLSRAEYVPTLASLAREIASDRSIWLTTGGDVAEWWLGRADLDARVTRRGNQLEVTVVNPARRVVENAIVRVVLPRGFAVRTSTAPLLASPEPGVARVKLRFIPGRSQTVIRLGI
jgi:peptidoglycan/xylan/chitin deacetylase (PgdA/CDA1 family)